MKNNTQSAQLSKPKTKRVQSEKPRRKSRDIDSLMQLMNRPNEKAVQFEISAAPDSQVYVAGSFNNWDPTSHPLELNQEEGVFRSTITLPEGKYEYKFVVNGVWQMDSNCPLWVPNQHGSLNSVVHV